MRPAPDGWIHVKTAQEAIDILENNEVESISLDNDLGDNVPEGYTVLDFIEERFVEFNILPPKVLIHTANPVARKRMLLTLKSIERLIERR